MRRTLRPAVDQLEGKALMAGFIAPIHAPAAPAVPAGVVGTVTVSAPTIAPQGTVTASLVETNTTSSTVSFAVPVSKEGFAIYEGATKVFQSPVSTSQNIQLVTLAPGQSTTLFSATWNDTGNVHPITSTGTFTVVNEFDTAASSPTVTVTSTPDSGGNNNPVNPPTSPVFPKYPPKLHYTF